MKRRAVIDRRLYPETGLYHELLLVEYDSEYTEYGDGELFKYRIVHENEYALKTGGIERNIRELVIETNADLPFKEGDRIVLSEEDTISYFGSTRAHRAIVEVQLKPDKHYNNIKAKYPNRKLDITLKQISLK